VHLVDAMGNSEHLWGKERVVASLMRVQRASGVLEPRLVTFTPGLLGAMLAAEGFRTDTLGLQNARFPLTAARNLSALMRADDIRLLHTHGYKANLVGKALRVLGALRGCRLVSTCHGWVETDVKLRAYCALDRWSSPASDVTTVPDPAMLARLSRFGVAAYVPNGVPETDALPDPGPALRKVAGEFLAGTLGRVSAEKGIPELLAAARNCREPSIIFTVAGAGGLTGHVAAAAPNVRYVGYFSDPRAYLAALDIYVQASRSEGLSLALLEAMRAGKPIVATDVGATRDAIVDRESALLVPAGEPERLLAAVLALRRDPALALRLGRNARLRYEADFRMQRQHERFLQLYFPSQPKDQQRI